VLFAEFTNTHAHKRVCSVYLTSKSNSKTRLPRIHLRNVFSRIDSLEAGTVILDDTPRKSSLSFEIFSPDLVIMIHARRLYRYPNEYFLYSTINDWFHAIIGRPTKIHGTATDLKEVIKEDVREKWVTVRRLRNKHVNFLQMVTCYSSVKSFSIRNVVCTLHYTLK
jgi:hypothetical protein